MTTAYSGTGAGEVLRASFEVDHRKTNSVTFADAEVVTFLTQFPLRV